MLEVKEAAVYYENSSGIHTAIENLSFSLEKGSVLAIAGPSGCGKSSLIHTLAGVLKLSGGEALLSGVPISMYDGPIGLIPQNLGLLPWKTVKENCMMGILAPAASRKERRLAEKEGEKRLEALCRTLKITSLLSRYPHTLSGGQAQRAALARAFLLNPALLLMDEPFAALDTAAVQRASGLSLELIKKYRTTTVLITHRLEEALYMADKIGIMEQGGSFRFFCENPWQGIQDPVDPAYTALLAKLTKEVVRASEKEEQT